MVGESGSDVYVSSDDSSALSGHTEQVQEGTQVQPVRKRKRGRPPSSSKASNSKRLSEVPGDPRFEASNWSVTVSRPSDDIAVSTIDIIDDFMKEYCLAGGAATEVGKRAFRFHLQCLFRLKYPTSDLYKKKLQTFIRRLLPGKGVGYRIHAKPLAGTQTFTAMLGYILKDEGRCDI